MRVYELKGHYGYDEDFTEKDYKRFMSYLKEKLHKKEYDDEDDDEDDEDEYERERKHKRAGKSRRRGRDYDDDDDDDDEFDEDDYRRMKEYERRKYRK